MGLFIGAIVVNTNDMQRAIVFWTQALGYEVRQDERDFVVLQAPDTRGPRLSLQVTNEPKLALNRLHLDLFTTDQAGEVARLELLGAKRLRWNYPEDPDFIVMADPDGNEFCVIQTDKGPNE
jgi:catechol 2,3-dioxygenase-like lactoylglutathione lyase family enzyme